MNTEDQTLYGTEQPVTSQITGALPENGSIWKRVAIAGTSAIVLGAGTIAATRLLSHDEVAADGNDATAEGELHVAEVDQDLSFADAFADAREQVGEGGVFHWHGNVYSTFTAEEWDSLTPFERDAFALQVQPEIADEVQNPTGVEHTAHHTETHHDQPEAQPTKQPAEHDQPTDGTTPAGGAEGDAHEPEVHFLGIETDVIDGQQVNVGHMSVDDVHVALIDVDDDRVFDVSIADTNRNNQFDEQDRIEDISDMNLSVDQFAEASVQEASSHIDDQSLASSQGTQDLAPDMPDYVNDADVETV